MLIDVDRFLEALENEGADVCEDYYEYAVWGFSRETISAAINRVNREMSADVYLWQRERMCHSFDKATYDPSIDGCEDCPLIDCCSKRGGLEDAEAVDIVKKWMQEHTEERSEE